jgi:hypothetical protein
MAVIQGVARAVLRSDDSTSVKNSRLPSLDGLSAEAEMVCRLLGMSIYKVKRVFRSTDVFAFTRQSFVDPSP